MTAPPTTRRDLALDIWRAQLNEPYLWAGDDPLAGFDCSGLVNEGLKAAGILPRDGDWNADALSRKFRRILDAELKPGCLLFWNRGGTIGHVEIVHAIIGGQVFTIGASGGGSKTKTLEDAIAQNAYVKIRPAVAGWTVAVDPFE